MQAQAPDLRVLLRRRKAQDAAVQAQLQLRPEGRVAAVGERVALLRPKEREEAVG